MQNFNGKVVWITGASSGYGEAVAKACAKAGAKLVLSARRTEKLNQLAKNLGNAVVVPLDLAQFDTFEQRVKEAIAAFGHIDIMMHNGAIAQNAKVMDTTLAVERHIMDVDYFSYTELNRLVLPHMQARKSGQIVVTSGLLAHLALPGRSSYAAAKAALIAYFDCLRVELMGQGIDVTILIPGAMQTALAAKAVQADGEPDATKADHVSPAGVSLEEAARQTLTLIAEKRMQAYVGLEDDSFRLWQLTRSDPDRGIQMMLERLKSAAKA
jgi:Short-chain dehydrogenases of various substrate specificities